MSLNTMLFLAEMSLDLGLVGLDEYEERVHVAHWVLADDELKDPRLPPLKQEAVREEQENPPVRSETQQSSANVGQSQNHGYVELIALGIWYFTGSDPDCYPSVPHGHYRSENQPWPKLNPYTGRAFSAKHQEDPSLRLSKKEMRDLWRDDKFRKYCRHHIMWYMEEFSHYRFRVRRPLRLPRW